MNTASTILGILELVDGLTQAALSNDTGINKGQLSSFLKNNHPLAEDKQVQLIECLLDKLAELRKAESLPSDVDLLIGQLKNYPPYQIIHDEATPGSIILPGHKCYVEPSRDLLDEMRSRPFVLGITGGPKTGKSILGRSLQYRLRKKERVIFADCKKYEARHGHDPGQFVGWLAATAATQWGGGFKEYPYDWAGMIQWLKIDLLSGKEPCTFIFDHLEALGEAYQSFSSGWHNVLNQSRKEPVVDELGLVFIFDEAAPELHASRMPASRVEQRMRTVVAQPFSQGGMGSLLDAEIGDSNDYQLRAKVWELFQGHPYLTHCFLRAYGNSRSSSESEAEALAAAHSAFNDDITPRLLGNIYQDTLRKQINLQENLAFKAAHSHALFLQDTLLFEETDDQQLRCATPWIHKRLVELISRK